MINLDKKIALVTGASRGVGKGIAVSLAEAGMLVYITGRTINEGDSGSKLTGTIYQTQVEIEEKGGKCIVLQCDHRDDEQVKMVFNRIHKEHKQIDVLVNNVWGGYEYFTNGTEFWNESGFWTAPVSRWDSMFEGGIRAHYYASCLAAPLMVENKKGFIVNISFYAAERDDQGVAYAASKAASNRMSSSMAYELKDHNVSVVSLYPGLVRTESVLAGAEFIDLSNSESPEFVGRAIVALAKDESLHEKSGCTLKTAELAIEYGFSDIDGKCPRPFCFQGE
jgi:dehydrogenase/reductase SDR family protein 1